MKKKKLKKLIKAANRKHEALVQETEEILTILRDSIGELKRHSIQEKLRSDKMAAKVKEIILEMTPCQEGYSATWVDFILTCKRNETEEDRIAKKFHENALRELEHGTISRS